MPNQRELIRALAVFSAVLLILTCANAFLPIHGEERIYSDITRLHILANSDTEQDQSLKLRVRDEVVKQIGEMVSDCATHEEAEQAIFAALPAIKSCAESEIREAGYDYNVEVSLTRELYPIREYERVMLPAGEYSSLQVKIGAAEGKNWWCILFPPLCLDASQAEQALEAGGFSGEQINALTKGQKPKYKIRFKILELLGKRTQQ